MHTPERRLIDTLNSGYSIPFNFPVVRYRLQEIFVIKLGSIQNCY